MVNNGQLWADPDPDPDPYRLDGELWTDPSMSYVMQLTSCMAPRNAILGRENAPEETQGLADGSIAK